MVYTADLKPAAQLGLRVRISPSALVALTGRAKDCSGTLPEVLAEDILTCGTTISTSRHAQVVELVYTLALEASDFGHAGSTPVLSTFFLG